MVRLRIFLAAVPLVPAKAAAFILATLKLFIAVTLAAVVMMIARRDCGSDR